jgi:hypothetical protein
MADERDLPPVRGRDPFIDLVRAASLVIVVLWHWVFSVILWGDDGPWATNPLGFTSGLFVATWLLQVMPLFFFVGGWAHTQAYASFVEARRGSAWAFSRRRLATLARPALGLAVVWWLVGIGVAALFDVAWTGRAVLLVLSPLWFLVVYGLLIALFPVAHRLHQRFDLLVLVWAGGLAVCVDVVRFRWGWDWLGWLNMVLVWGLCHQLGFFYRRLVAAGRNVAWSLASAGLFALVGLVISGLYPGSMVGVPGDRFSNMAPPTVCIVALVLFQAGVALLVRPSVLSRLDTRARWRRASATMNRFSLPLYLFHSSGLAIWVVLVFQVIGYNDGFGLATRFDIDAAWWLTRPLAVIGPALCTAPMLWGYARLTARS